MDGRTENLRFSFAIDARRCMSFTEQFYTPRNDSVVVESRHNSETHNHIQDSHVDPLQALAHIEENWQKQGSNGNNFPLLCKLVSFTSTVFTSKLTPLDDLQRLALVKMLQDLCDAVAAEQTGWNWKVGSSRSTDGILNVDAGPFPLFDDCVVPTLEEALSSIDISEWEGENHWPCDLCQRPTNDPYEDHMMFRHPGVPLGQPAPLVMAAVFDCLERNPSPYPAITVYTMETPIYRAANKAMREWKKSPEQFSVWKGFSALLNWELHKIPTFEGNVFRAVDCLMPPGLYNVGAVVTWNQPSSASTDPRVIRDLILSDDDGKATLFIIHSIRARPISQYSIYPEEAEVLFPAGTQFQVCSQAHGGLKKLLELATHCNLDGVDVYQMRELMLDSWSDLEHYLEPGERLRNRELLDFIDSLPTQLNSPHGIVKKVCAPMSKLIRRESDGASAVHMAVAVPENLSCLHLVCSHLRTEDLSVRNAAGLTPLQVAVEAGHGQAAVFLLQRGADLYELNRQQRFKATPFVAQRGEADQILQLCAILRNEGTAGQGALRAGLAAAAVHRGRSVVPLLMDAEPEMQDIQEALTLAAEAGNEEVVALLLEHKASINCVGASCLSPLMAAAKSGQTSIAQMLLEANADLHLTQKEGMNALMFSAKYGQRAVATVLLEAKADIHAKDKDHTTALLYACSNGNPLLVEMLLEANADVYARQNDGTTAVILAARSNHVLAISKLLEAKADVNASRRDGTTPLIAAAEHGHTAAVHSMLQANANVNQKCRSQQTAAILAAKDGNATTLRTLIGALADLHIVDQFGMNALTYACQEGRSSVVEILLRAGVSLTAPSKQQPAPLHLAADKGHLAVVQKLLHASADVDARCPKYTTPLMAASRSGHAAVTMLLLKYSADVNVVDAQGWTPVMYAAAHGHVDIIHLLVLRQAKLDVVDLEGYTAQTLAIKFEHLDAQNVLKAAVKAYRQKKRTKRSNSLKRSATYTFEPVYQHRDRSRSSDGISPLMPSKSRSYSSSDTGQFPSEPEFGEEPDSPTSLSE